MNRIDEAENSETGLLLRRALDMRMALKLGIHITLDEVRADEFMAMQILDQEYEKHEREKMPGNHGE